MGKLEIAHTGAKLCINLILLLETIPFHFDLAVPTFYVGVASLSQPQTTSLLLLVHFFPAVFWRGYSGDGNS